jgi:long-subunit acyl-CoA synthetase (AMP-forming)
VIWAPNAPEWVLLEYACALTGITIVTANPAFKASELAYVIKQSKAAGLFLPPSTAATQWLESPPKSRPKLRRSAR